MFMSNNLLLTEKKKKIKIKEKKRKEKEIEKKESIACFSISAHYPLILFNISTDDYSTNSYEL